MATDLFERLADLDVPPPPAQFDDQLHDRVNRSLAVGQMMDLLFGAVPWAVVEFSRAVIGTVLFTLTGRYETKPNRRRQ